ncbi:hypothetical protein LCGC14_2666320, partial [marine sediment metagenome]
APVPPPILLDKSPSYRRERVETIEATLDYKITSEEQLTNIRHEVEVYADGIDLRITGETIYSISNNLFSFLSLNSRLIK